MSNQFLGEIRCFPFNYAPSGWALCNGQIMAIQQNTALFSLLGTNFGGNGSSNFGLPNLQGCVANGQGQLPGGSQYSIGEFVGSATVTLNGSQIAGHTHTLPVAGNTTNKQPTPAGNFLGATADRQGGTDIYAGSSDGTIMLTGNVGPNVGGQPHNNMGPFLVTCFCIALVGIFPQRQ